MATNLKNIENFFEENINITVPASTNVSLYPKTPDEIIKKAKDLGIGIFPLDIYCVIKKIFSIKIYETDIGKDVSGFLEKIGNTWAIYVNRNESEYRKRFTLAHELGHYILHREIPNNSLAFRDQIFFRDENTSPQEKEANKFAANLLMPQDDFLKAIKDGDNPILKLADKFKLSTAAVRYRAYQLGLIKSY